MLHVQDVLPTSGVNGFKSLLERLDHLIAACILDEDVAIVCARTEGKDLWGSDIVLEVLEHPCAVGFSCIDPEDLFALFAVEGVEIRAAAIRPGLLHEFLMEPVDVLLMVNDEEVDDIFGDRSVGSDVVAIGRSTFLVVKSGHRYVGALVEGVSG